MLASFAFSPRRFVNKWWYGFGGFKKQNNCPGKVLNKHNFGRIRCRYAEATDRGCAGTLFWPLRVATFWPKRPWIHTSRWMTSALGENYLSESSKKSQPVLGLRDRRHDRVSSILVGCTQTTFLFPHSRGNRSALRGRTFMNHRPGWGRSWKPWWQLD